MPAWMVGHSDGTCQVAGISTETTTVSATPPRGDALFILLTAENRLAEEGTKGPDSAGSEPGPASYDRGGTEPTVTDADVMLGRIGAKGFAGGAYALKPTKAETALKARIGTPLRSPSGAATQVVPPSADIS